MERRTKMMRVGGRILLVLAALAPAGCVSSRSDVTYGPQGPAVGRNTLRQIRCGETSKEWLLGVLGEPSRATPAANGTEILTYEYTRTVDSEFDLFLLFDADDRREERTVYLFEVQDGIVTKYWKQR